MLVRRNILTRRRRELMTGPRKWNNWSSSHGTIPPNAFLTEKTHSRVHLTRSFKAIKFFNPFFFFMLKSDVYSVCKRQKWHLRIVQWGKILSTENRRQVNLWRISCFLIPKNVFHVKGYVISVKMVQKRISFIYQCCDQRLPKLDSSMHPFWIKFAGSPSSPWSQPTRSLHLVPNIYKENVGFTKSQLSLFRVSSKCINLH